MIPKEILKQVKKIEIRTTKLVNEAFGGEYLSAFKGQGMEFADVREYTHGDDIRAIDWNVTARAGAPFIKQFLEERELTVLFLADISRSHHFGSHEKLKSDVAAEVTALLAFSAVKNNDKVGLITFTDQIEKYIPVQKGKQHVLRVVREILYNTPKGIKTDIGHALEYVNKAQRKRAVIFLVSDFLGNDYDKPLKILARYHDLILVRIFDPREYEIPPVGHVCMEDPETGETALVDTSSRSFRQNFAKQQKENETALLKKLTAYGIDTISIDVSKPYVEPIAAFFTKRTKR